MGGEDSARYRLKDPGKSHASHPARLFPRGRFLSSAEPSFFPSSGWSPICSVVCVFFFKCFLSPYFCQDGIKCDSVSKSLQASLTSRKLDLGMIFECELGSLLFFAKGGLECSHWTPNGDPRREIRMTPFSQVWWHTSLIPAFWVQRQVDGWKF